jgi:Fe2+ or Zn2+ uptake regulation protein
VQKSPPVSPTPGAPESPRRNRSRQRDRILDWLRATDSHPSAAQIHAALAPETPGLSLGTVYRNLEVLVADGRAEEVSCAGGPARYDANVDPHHHFTCDGCGRILDVEVPVPRSLAKRLAGEQGLHARRISITFYGLCSECSEHSDTRSTSASVQPARTSRRPRQGRKASQNGNDEAAPRLNST